MNRLRQMMDEQPKRFLTALQQASDAGFQVSGERYARPKRAGLPPLLEEVANRKCFSFDREEPDPAFYEFGSTGATANRQFPCPDPDLPPASGSR